MIRCYLGIDVGSVSTKGVILDELDNILCESYIWTEGNPIKAVKKLLSNMSLHFNRDNYEIIAVGVTGSARRLIGSMLDASIIKNEITAHAVGAISRNPDVRTILEIGGQDSKIIIIENGIVVDYAMNTLCAAGTGAFLSSQSKRLGVDVENFGSIAFLSKNPAKIAARCTVFAESDLVHKAGAGYKKEDIIAGLCQSITRNYLNNVAKGKKIMSPIMFQGGVSKNVGVKKAFEDYLDKKVMVDDKSHLMGAIGASILARKSKVYKPFSFDITDIDFKTSNIECNKCPNNCDIVCFKQNDKLLDYWGNRCENGSSSIV